MAGFRDIGISDIAALSNADLTAKQYYFAELTDTDGTMDVFNGASTTYSPFGVIQNKAASGGELQVRVLGFSKLVCAATTAAPGTWLTSNASGQGVATTEASLAHAIAMETTDTSLSCIIQVYIEPSMGWLTRNHA